MYGYDGTAPSAVNWEDGLAIWGPRIIFAIGILLIAWALGRAAKWALARALDKTPGIRTQNAGVEEGRTVGARLGEVANWLILLFGVVAALNVLQLGQAAGPLNTLLTTTFGYVPNVIGAGLIFFIGYIVATLARRVVTAALQAANVDSLLGKLGLGAVSQAGLANVLGTLVFVLIIIPVAVAALEALNIEAISRPAITVLTTVLNAIPLVLAAAIVLAIGFFIGRWVASLVERLLPATGFDRYIGALGAFSSYTPDQAQAPTTSSVPEMGEPQPVTRITPSKIVAQLVMWGIVAFSAIEAARLLQFAAIAAILEEVVSLAGRVVIGGIIITAGVIIGDLLANAIDRSTSGADRFASTLVRWATIALATAMGLSFMGIAEEIVMIAFALTLGSAAIAAALAFGLGGREAAGRIASQWADKIQQKPKTPPAPKTPITPGE
ncbi:MAG TPA: mechanosensitive ion channel [Caulobacteraceae bacterium]|nr:mechanosensitive ion channel [Caulobacteraceae bacterium]